MHFVPDSSGRPTVLRGSGSSLEVISGQLSALVESDACRICFVDRYWPIPPAEATAAAKLAAEAAFGSNMHAVNSVPLLKTMHDELRTMVAEVSLAKDSDCVSITQGGTESNFLAMKAGRNRWRERGGTGTPSAVFPWSAHPDLDKAAEELGLDVRRTETNSAHELSIDSLGRHIDGQTAIVVVSAPSYVRSVVDPVASVAELTSPHDIWLHVDASMGFLLPFIQELGVTVEAHRFDVRGVTSLTVGLHKFGMCPTGISALVVAESELVRFHTFQLREGAWPYGPYRRVAFGGSRSGEPVATAWATLRALGREGYRKIAANILRTTNTIVQELGDVAGLVADASTPCGTVLIQLPLDLEPTEVAAALLRRGWEVPTCDEPRGLHVLLSTTSDDVTSAFLRDLSAAVRDLIEPPSPQ